MALTEEQRNPWRAIVAGGDYNLSSQDWEDLLTELDSLYPGSPIARPDDVPCEKCGQVPQGQSGIYECPKCGLPLVHDALPASAPSEQKPVYQFRPECENWIDCTEQFYESWRGEKRELYAAPQPEQENYKAQRDALLGKVIEARQALQFANDTPCGPINDTIWMMHGPETLFDFLDAAIASVKGGE